MELVLIRHGQSEANVLGLGDDGLFCGRFNAPLTELGIQQAQALKGSPEFEGAEAVFCSPLVRAIETAKQLTDLPLILDDRIVERTIGVFDGQRIAYIRSIPEYEKYFTNPEFTEFRTSFTVKAPAGENWTDVESRVRSFLEDIVKQGCQKVIVVSHTVAIRCMLKVIRGLSEEETIAMKVKNCAPIVEHFG